MDYLWTSLKQVIIRSWHGLYLAGRRHNHRLIGFYSYHYETGKRLLDTINRKAGKVRQSPKAATALRLAVFWPLMGLAAVLLYTGQSPFTPRQLGLPINDAEWGIDEPRPNLALLPETPSAPTDSAQATASSTPAVPKPAVTHSAAPAKSSSAPAANQQPARTATTANAAKVSAAKKAATDPVAEAMAQLPPFSPEKPVRPAAGETIGGIGWRRDQVTGDWVWQPGVTIATAEPGEPVVAAYAGVVTVVEKERAGTWSVVLSHRSGWQSEYGGLERVSVEPHAVVSRGAQLGQTPAVASSVLSFTLRQNDTAVDPTKYLQ